MKTLAEYQVSFDLRNQTYQANVFDDIMPLQNSLLPGLGRSRTCYVILEEQSGDVMVDNNGNGQRSDAMTSSYNRRLSTNQQRNDGKNNGDNNLRTNDNTTLPKQSHHIVNLNESLNRNCDNDVADTSPWPSPKQAPSTSSNNSAATTTVDVPTNLLSLDSSHQDAPTRPDNYDRSIPMVKSGHLVLIVSDNNSKCALLNSDRITSGGPRTSGPQRCPVIVKIGGRGYDKYAIISSTRRRRGSQSVCLKLKHSQATQSASNLSQFTVVLDGDDAKLFLFEAGSPEVASEWIRCFSSSPNHKNGSLKQTRGRSRQTTRVSTSSPGHVSPSSSTLDLSHVPLMPALSESLDEDDDEFPVT